MLSLLLIQLQDPVDELIIDDGGFDFEIGDKLNFDNEGTEGGGGQPLC